MMKNRVEITLKFSADLDQVPGWGFDPKDWVDLVKSQLGGNEHYNTKTEILDVKLAKFEPHLYGGHPERVIEDVEPDWDKEWDKLSEEDKQLYRDLDDYDGQPDEAQEWYDFDPDC